MSKAKPKPAPAKRTPRRACYVVVASDCSPTGVLGVHGSHPKARQHYLSVVTDRKRWYVERWTHWDADTAYTRERDPLFRLREWHGTHKGPETPEGLASAFMPGEVSVYILRVWRS